MKTTAINHIASLINNLISQKVTHFVLSPGSRNAPLIIAIENHPKAKSFLIHDERSAAFFALGMAEEIGRPVAIVCTSGSASLNYAPAVAEAYYRQIPLLVLTADRPSYLINQGDGQCIVQPNIYNNYSKAYFNYPEATNNKVDLKDSNEVDIQIVSALTKQPLGPIHVNIPLYEPLYEISDIKEYPIINIEDSFEEQSALSDDKITELKARWNKAKKKMIIIGQLSHADDVKPMLDLLAENNSVAILVENTSNLQNFYKYSHSIDRSLNIIKKENISDYQPDLILSFGGAIVSKKIKVFLRESELNHNWRIGNYLIEEDTFLSKSEAIKLTPAKFLKLFINEIDQTNSNYRNKWKTLDFIAQDKHNAYFDSNNDYSDLKVIDAVLANLPVNSSLQMSNSSVVRYCQLFNPIQTVTYYANRGVSGIDGSTSTAVGMAVANPSRLVTLITGDISFFYDSNALWNSYLPQNLRIIIVNNGGGGIFNILEGSRNSEQNNSFVAPFEAKIEFICKSFDVGYVKVSSLKEIESKMTSFYDFSDSERPKVMEIDTKKVRSHEDLMNYFQSVVQA